MADERMPDVPEGVDPEAFARRIKELRQTLPMRGAVAVARREFASVEERCRGLTGKALDEARKGHTLRDQQAEARRIVMAEENGNEQSRGRKPDPKSDRRKVLAAALKAIQENDGSLSRKDLDDKVKVRTKGKTAVSAWVGEACSQGLEVDGHKFVRTGRGIYGVEAVAAE